MSAFIPIRPGTRFGRLTVVAETRDRIAGRRTVRCRCDCGGETAVKLDHLRSGHTSSCGCRQREVASVTARSVHARGLNRSPYRSMRGPKAWTPHDTEEL